VTHTNDIFARVAVERYEARSQQWSRQAASVPQRKLPLDKIVGAAPLNRCQTEHAAELRLELEQARQVMAEFLADLAPGSLRPD